MSQLAFDHLLNLSLSWHVHRKTGEVLRILDRGAAINRILEVCTSISSKELRSPATPQLILFNIVPTFCDIAIALVYFAVIFDWTLTVVIAVATIAYSESTPSVITTHINFAPQLWPPSS